MNIGMTNTSNVIELDGHKYVIRRPGVGTSEMIDRVQEMKIYELIKDFDISDEVLYIDETGMKITRFIENARNCNAKNWSDVKTCIWFLKTELHNRHLKCEHIFELKERIQYYRKLAGQKSEYFEYEATERKVFKLLEWVNTLKKDWCLTHIDANPDNFILSASKGVTLLDWEYAAMQDPHVDIAMFAIYSGYTQQELDELINIYFDGEPDYETKMKIYAYVAICGLLWSNWCEYKHKKGQEFGGDYELSQYMYAVNYSNIVLRYLCEIDFGNEKTSHIKAIILAAGKGVRLGKLTEETPKPLLRVCNKRMIDTCIGALRCIGIKDIEVITGYKHEQFEKLEDFGMYKGVTFTFNKDYDKGNNILSLNCAKTKGDVIILDADQLLDPTIFKSLDFSHSFYCNQPCVADTTSDWEIKSTDDNIILSIDITHCSLYGKQLKSISFWRDYDFEVLKSKIKAKVKAGEVNTYWDNVAVEILPTTLIYTYQVSNQEAIEIDTYEDYTKYGGTL